MKLLGLLAIAGALAIAQVSPVLTIPTTPINPGQSITVTVSISSAAGSSPTAVNWGFTFNAALWGAPAWAIGSAASAASKLLNCLSTSGQVKCLVDGPNSTVIGSGVIATITLPLLATAPPGTTPLALTSPGVSDGTGTAIVAVVPPPGSITIAALISACDLNADGKTDQSDVALGRAQVIGPTACGAADLSKDGACNAVDVQRLQNAASGAACRIG